IAVAGIIPSIFVTGANVIVFGPVNGSIISWVGEVIGALVCSTFTDWALKRDLNAWVKNTIC
ncbi:putative membrane protein, partial [Desulfosporosinus sp. OT]